MTFLSIFKPLDVKRKYFIIAHENIERFIIEIIRGLDNISTNIFGVPFIEKNHNFNLKYRPEHEILSIKSELKCKHKLESANIILASEGDLNYIWV